MRMEEIMLKIDNVSKKYVLGQLGGTTLRDELQRFSAKIHGREDPTKTIGTRDYNKGETFMALNGISFEVKKGERIGIIGHNGAGKSTLLKLISRVTAPTGGTICLNGRVASMLEVGTGFHGELTGRENIYMNGAILGMTKKEIDAKIEDIIEFSECRQFIDTPVKRYSSGMYVKLAFSVAAHLDSEIMIMDEVLAVGDMAFQKKCLEKMSDVSKKEGRTILYVSHNMNTIRQLCDRVIVLDHGIVAFDGNIEEGIDIYMGIQAGEALSVEYNLQTIPRLYQFGEHLLITRFRFLNKQEPVYYSEEPIIIALNLTSKINLEKVNVVITIKDSSYNKIGMTLSDDFSIYQGKNQMLTLKLILDTLSPGMYCLGISIISIYDNKEHYAYDDPGTKILFEIKDKNYPDIIWHKEYWGNVRFPNMQFVNSELLYP